MAEKKEHHLTRAKRLREEAELETSTLTPEETAPIIEALANLPKKMEIGSRPYRVFDNRAALVAQVNSIEEAEEEVKRFPGGTYRMI